MNSILSIAIFAGMAAFIVSLFFWADYKVRKRNKEEYERTGISANIYEV